MFVQLSIIVSSIIFAIAFGSIVMMRKSFLITLISLESMLLSVNLSVIGFSYLWQNTIGQVLALLIISIGAVEIVVGLAILVIHYHVTGSIFVDK